MSFEKPSAPDLPAARQAEKPNRDRRENGEADVVDVPQADGDSRVKPAEKPAKPVDNRANGWKGR